MMQSNATILIADDDRAIRAVLSRALGRVGHRVRATGNASTLWQWVQAGDGDLVITDVHMPDGDGLELVPRIRALRPDMAVIVMSAQNTLLTAVKATDRGAFEYLPKPFDLTAGRKQKRALAWGYFSPSSGPSFTSSNTWRLSLRMISTARSKAAGRSAASNTRST